MSDTKSIILTAFKNNCPLHNFILLTCNIVNITNPIIEIIKANLYKTDMYNCMYFSVLFCC